MKKVSSLFILFAIVAFSATNLLASGKAQTEVLYFKDQLGCCQARSCDALEKNVKEFIEKNFSSDQVAYKQVDLKDKANAELVKKHKAKSQTVVVITKNKKGAEKAVDISDVIRNYNRSRSLENLEKELVEKIKEAIG